MDDQKAAAIDALLDKQAIHELIHRYARASDRHDHALLATLYWDDAIDDHGGFFKGLATEFIEKLPEIQAPMRILHHNITTVNIELDGNSAEGEVYVLAYHQVDTENGPMDLLIGGRYLDKYEKRGDHWRFSYKAVLADWAVINNDSVVDLKHPMLTGSHFGQPGPQDPSYQLLNTFKFGGS